SIHFCRRKAKTFDDAVPLDDQALKVGYVAVARGPGVYDDKFEIGEHAVLMQRRIRAHEVDLPVVSHLMNDLAEQQIYPVRCFESQYQTYKEATLGDNGINRVLARVGRVNRVNVKEPIHVGPLRPLPENRINDV